MGDDGEAWSLCEPREKRDEMRLADLTGADSIVARLVGRRMERKRVKKEPGEGDGSGGRGRWVGGRERAWL